MRGVRMKVDHRQHTGCARKGGQAIRRPFDCAAGASAQRAAASRTRRERNAVKSKDARRPAHALSALCAGARQAGCG